MSEVKLNLIDSQQILHGTIHGSVADSTVAALSAQPETIVELQAALARYIKPREAVSPFACFYSTKHKLLSDCAGLDLEPWDAGIVVIDLAARIVAAESTYSMPGPTGEVRYHDGTQSTEVTVPYRVSDDWLFLFSIAEYEYWCGRRRMERGNQPPLDARSVLYGRPLLEFISNAVATLAETGILIPASQARTAHASASSDINSTAFTVPALGQGLGEMLAGNDSALPISDGREGISTVDNGPVNDDAAEEALASEISNIHARWLVTPREDFRGQSPRNVLFANQDFIDFDLHTRELQWTFQGEGPPCLAQDSYAYRFAGFGTHEWVVYYDLMRHLLWSALENVQHGSVCRDPGAIDRANFVGQAEDSSGIDSQPARIDSEMARLEEVKTAWLEQPQQDYGGKIPAIIIENERKRLPLALRPRDMIIDEDCPMCQMFGDETTLLGMGVGFWHLDGAHMDDDFAFSDCKTREEWEAENRRREEFNKEFNRRWEERKQRIARGEVLEPDPFFDPDPFPGLEFDDSSLVSNESIDDDNGVPQ